MPLILDWTIGTDASWFSASRWASLYLGWPAEGNTANIIVPGQNGRYYVEVENFYINGGGTNFGEVGTLNLGVDAILDVRSYGFFIGEGMTNLGQVLLNGIMFIGVSSSAATVNVQFSGTGPDVGAVTLTGLGDSRLKGVSSDSVLINTDHIIEGDGTIENLQIVNQANGIIRASMVAYDVVSRQDLSPGDERHTNYSAGDLTIDLTHGSLTNYGVVEAVRNHIIDDEDNDHVAFGTLTILKGAIQQGPTSGLNGTISANDEPVHLQDVMVIGGTLTTTNIATISLYNDVTFDGSEAGAPIQLRGRVSTTGATLDLTGTATPNTLTIHGTIAISNSPDGSTLGSLNIVGLNDLDSQLLIDTGGATLIPGDGVYPGTVVLAGGEILAKGTANATLNSSIAIQGYGAIGAHDGHLTLTLNGHGSGIAASDPMFVSGPMKTLTVDTGNVINNGGYLAAIGAKLIVKDSVIGGNAFVEQGGILQFDNSFQENVLLSLGTLKVSQPFHGTIAAFSAGDGIDLSYLFYNSSIPYEMVWHQDGSTGTLTVSTHGFDVAVLNLIGTYSQSDFLQSGDDAGGTLITFNINNMLDGDEFPNFLDGGVGDDILNGNGGGDILWGGPGMDRLSGGPGSDSLDGGGDRDRLNGGLEGDTFSFGLTALDDAMISVIDRVEDYNQGDTGLFSAAEGDIIDLSALTSTAFDGGQAASSLVRFVDHPGNAKVLLQVDVDGTDNGIAWTTLAELDHLHGSDSVKVLLSGSQPGGTSIAVQSNSGHLGDFDADGKADLVWRNDSGVVATWEMNGNSVQASHFLVGVRNDWHILGTGDFNADGHTDLLWNNDNGSLITWQMTSASHIGATPSLGNAPSNAFLAGIGDTDGDGKSDLIWRDSSTGAVTISITDGTSNTIALGEQWGAVGVGDYNGDGTDDIMFRNPGLGVNAAWLMAGSAIANVVFFPGVPNDWHVAGTGDFNGDGTADLFWHNDNGGNALWLMTVNAEILDAAFFDGVSPDWHVAGTGDFNNDHKDDLIWRNDAGATAVWQMDGVNTPAAGFPGGVPTDWATQAHHYEYV